MRPREAVESIVSCVSGLSVWRKTDGLSLSRCRRLGGCRTSLGMWMDVSMFLVDALRITLIEVAKDLLKGDHREGIGAGL